MGRLAPVAVFAAAMAFVEAAVVVYLRRLMGVVEPWRDPSVYDATIAAVEVAREAATLVMIAALGWACGRSVQARIGFALFTFGVWDIFYYVWLEGLLGWPGSILTPDILFLIPVPWWGPVLTPILVAVLMTATGAAAVTLDDRGVLLRPGVPDWLVIASGTIVVLYAFMADAIAVLPASADTLSAVRPGPFRWGLYAMGLALMAAGAGRPVAAALKPRRAR